VSPGATQLLASIKALSPWTMSWSNLADYLLPQVRPAPGLHQACCQQDTLSANKHCSHVPHDHDGSLVRPPDDLQVSSVVVFSASCSSCSRFQLLQPLPKHMLQGSHWQYMTDEPHVHFRSSTPWRAPAALTRTPCTTCTP
jgi:hypothetical protein